VGCGTCKDCVIVLFCGLDNMIEKLRSSNFWNFVSFL